MDPLTALRSAIMAGREGDIVFDEAAKTVTIDGVTYDGARETAFRKGKKPKNVYPLLSVWLAWSLRGESQMHFIKGFQAHKATLVVVTDKTALLAYLKGDSDAAEYIEPEYLASGGGAGAGAGGAGAGAGGAPASKVSTAALAAALFAPGTGGAGSGVSALEAALAAEVPPPGRSRATVTDAPGRDFLEEVFRHFPNVEQRVAEDRAAAEKRRAVARAQAEAAAAANRKRGRDGEAAGAPSSASSSSSAAAVAGGAITPGTPVIVLPSSSSSLITMYNVEALLREGRFVPPAEARAAFAGAPKPTRITIERINTAGVPAKFYVIDAPEAMLRSRNDWYKVAAVFAHGPEWQFKGWRWGSPDRPADLAPPDIFSRCLGFHLAYEGDILHENIPKWNVTPLTVSKTRRYLDPGVAQKFWASLDAYLAVHKPYLLPRARQGGGGGGGAPAAGGSGGR